MFYFFMMTQKISGNLTTSIVILAIIIITIKDVEETKLVSLRIFVMEKVEVN